MAGKPTIAIVGVGNLGTALAVSLYKAGYRIDAIVARPGKSLARAKRLAREVRSRVVLDSASVRAQILWLCVPDTQIAQAAKSLADRPGTWKIALHSSGALTSDELAPLRKVGAAVASVHPLMTFVRRSRPMLTGVPFAIEGDPAAVRVVRQIVRDLGGQPYLIRKEDKPAYHAWGTFASPLLTALLATTEHVAGLAGVDAKSARRRVIPILLRTLENYGSTGAEGGFSGPIIRGDVETVRRHLEVLRQSPVLRQVYLALATAALEYLPAKNRRALKKLLDSA